jgi:hypothetical protein
MACQQDFYAGEDLEAILDAIDEDIWDKDEELNAEIDSFILGIEEPSKAVLSVKYVRNCASQNKVSQGIKMQDIKAYQIM